MRMIVIGFAVMVLGLGALFVSKPAEQGQLAATAQTTTSTAAAPYGPALGSGQPTTVLPISRSQDSTPGSTLVESSTAPEQPVGVNTTMIDEEVGIVHADGGHGEEEPADEFPDLAEGAFPITSNIDVGPDYPLPAMVDLAVDVLRAEVTGEGRDQYPHLVDAVSVCCEALGIDGAAVLFGPTQSDPASIVVEWHADAAGPEARTIRGSTETKWWWTDGTWLGEYALVAGATP